MCAPISRKVTHTPIRNIFLEGDTFLEELIHILETHIIIIIIIIIIINIIIIIALEHSMTWQNCGTLGGN